MDLGIEKKIALVTGSTTGIGFATAKMLAQEGATVYINGRTESKVKAAIEKIKKEYPKVDLKEATADLSTLEGCSLLFKNIPHVDILVNNLGIFETKEFQEITDEEWQHFFNVNVLSGVRLSRNYLPLMKQKNWGRIVFISSESGVNIPVEMIHYGVTKTAQLGLSRGLAETTAGTNVTVNSVLPGPTFTEGVEELVEKISKEKGMNQQDTEKYMFNTMRPSSLLKRFEHVDEIASLVTFVCSKNASGINGAALRVEGGVVRSII